jgi:hypothetical protein
VNRALGEKLRRDLTGGDGHQQCIRAIGSVARARRISPAREAARSTSTSSAASTEFCCASICDFVATVEENRHRDSAAASARCRFAFSTSNARGSGARHGIARLSAASCQRRFEIRQCELRGEIGCSQLRCASCPARLRNRHRRIETACGDHARPIQCPHRPIDHTAPVRIFAGVPAHWLPCRCATGSLQRAPSRSGRRAAGKFVAARLVGKPSCRRTKVSFGRDYKWGGAGRVLSDRHPAAGCTGMARRVCRPRRHAPAQTRAGGWSHPPSAYSSSERLGRGVEQLGGEFAAPAAGAGGSAAPRCSSPVCTDLKIPSGIRSRRRLRRANCERIEVSSGT